MIAGALLLSWALASTIGDAAGRSDYRSKMKQEAHLEHFWSVIAGSTTNDQGGVLNKLARDLRATPISGIYSFQGDSNNYGGISHELGFDPFMGVNCSECGELKTEVADDVVAVKKGQIVDVIRAHRPKPPDTGGGPGVFLWILWFLSLPIAVGLIYSGVSKVRGRRYKAMPDEIALVKQIDTTLEHTTFENAQDRYDLQQLRNKLMEQIEERVKYGDRAKQSMKLESLKTDARETLSAIEQGNKALQ